MLIVCGSSQALRAIVAGDTAGAPPDSDRESAVPDGRGPLETETESDPVNDDAGGVAEAAEQLGLGLVQGEGQRGS